MKKSVIILLFLSLTAFTIGDGHYFDIKKGNQKYEEGSYDEALKYYERARSQKKSDVSEYNLGDAYYRKGDYDAAAENFSAMLNSNNKTLARQGLLNFAAANLMAGFKQAGKGNADTAIKRLQTAASAYKKVLLGDPSDKSAKENMEIALNKIKELEKQKQKKKSQDKKQNKQDKAKQKKSDGEQEKQDKKQDKKGEEKKKAKNEKGEKEQKKHESADSKQKGKMTPDEVERILEALEQNEKKVQKSLRQNRVRDYEVEKDW